MMMIFECATPHKYALKLHTPFSGCYILLVRPDAGDMQYNLLLVLL